MKSPFVTRNLGISVGIGLCLGLGVLGLSTYASSQASSRQATRSETTKQESPQDLTSDVSQPIDSFITYDAPPTPVNPVHQKEDTPTLPVKEKTTQHSAIASTHSTKQVIPDSTVASSEPILLDARTTANAAIEATIAQNLPGLGTCPYTEPAASETIGAINEHRYTYHPVDLNGDHQDEVLVQVLGPMTCGTGGCTTLILQESADSNGANNPAYDVVTQMSVVNFPVIVSDRTSSGWSDLLVMVSGGGAQPGYRQLKFDGQSYPSNPSIEAMVASTGEIPNGKVLTVSENVGAIAPVISATDCDS